MRTRLPVLVLLAACFVMAGSGPALAKGGPDDCKHVQATGVGQDQGGGNTAATISGDPRLRGTTTAHFDIVGGAAPVFQIAGSVVFTTKKGTLTVGVAGTFDVSTGAFDASGPITSGTGKDAGVTGSLSFSGVQVLNTGSFTETINGSICRSDGVG